LKSANVKLSLKGPVYRYNPKTCRYERVGVSFWGALTYGSALLTCSLAILAGLLLLHDFLNDSAGEIAFRKENIALEKHSAILTKQLDAVEAKLVLLNEKDQQLHDKFFATEVDNKNSSDVEKHRSAILLANPDSFRKVIKEIDELSDELIGAAENANFAFLQSFEVDENSLSIIPSLPVYQPARALTAENLLSGFGKRINPFHKGLYDHPGIDIALPRGTEVIATASGKVSLVKRSDLQAGYGNYLEITHGNGFVTRYAHLEEIKVKVGQQVEKGSTIALSGNSGGSVAPHLHYEILRNEKNVDPILYMIHGLSTSEYEVFRSVSQKQNQSLD
jgi:murein DD-endopeptidase MepM/ murein hydrolase activator NlpD